MENADVQANGEAYQDPFPSSMTAIAVGIILAIIGSLITSNWEKESLINEAGFGMLLTGIAVFVVGLFGTAALALRNYIERREIVTGILEDRPSRLFGSIWFIGIGMAIAIIGSILGSTYAKETLLNSAGFGMQLAGIAVIVISTFEMIRNFANIYVSTNKQAVANGMERKLNLDLTKRAIDAIQALKTTRILYSVVGMMGATALLFFSLWQLDAIVSGPIWMSQYGSGWSHPYGAYADDTYRFFFWKTTIGQAYDTLLMLIFASFILLFVSAFIWPRGRPKEHRYVDEAELVERVKVSKAPSREEEQH